MSNNIEKLKQKAALEAIEFLKNKYSQQLLNSTSPLSLGLGSGSTIKYFIDALGKEVKSGMNIICVTTSKQTENQAKNNEIPLGDINKLLHLDIAIDGTDEFNQKLILIKGGGGALMREKIVANAASFLLIIADYSKKVEKLGNFPLPIEVEKFAFNITKMKIKHYFEKKGYNCNISLRKNISNEPFLTDNNNYILDCKLNEIHNPKDLAYNLENIPGVLEHGLFIDMADTVICAKKNQISKYYR